MLSATQESFLSGIVSDSGYPYYVVYQDTGTNTNNLIHIYLSKSPIAVNGSTFTITDGVYMQLTSNQYIRQVSAGRDYTFTIPVADTLCYTSTQDTPLYPSLIDTQPVTINYPNLLLVVFAGSLIGGIVKQILFGGK